MSMIGITDLPCSLEEEDNLEISNYVKGLEKFIRECPTPMSIAIQGDWGTGKTSTINLLKKRLESGNAYKNYVKCIYFNTWQYSQFRMSDDLYLSFVNSLVNKCCTNINEKETFMKLVLTIGKKAIYHTMEKSTGFDVSNIEDLLKNNEERMESVENLKSNFEKLVNNEFKQYHTGKLVIFIDDLDRLNPETAVELLEVIKLFMDVKNCIFVLAIDYEVVVNGVRKKYGEHISEEKCRSFFDKIIQLPFRMPVEAYKLDKLVKKAISDYIDESYISILTDFISNLLGSNPRSFKRLANCFFLIESVNETLGKDSQKDLDHVLTLCSLCIQMCIPKLYELIAVSSSMDELEKLLLDQDTKQYLEENLSDNDMSEADWKNIFRGISAFQAILEDIMEKGVSKDKVLRTLLNSIAMTAITNISKDNKVKRERSAPVKINRININGRLIHVKNPTEAMIETYKNLFQEDFDLMNDFQKCEERIITNNPQRKDSFFRNKRELFHNNDTTLFLGLSSSTSDKMKYVSKLCDFLAGKKKEAHVQWMYDEQILFDSKKY